MTVVGLSGSDPSCKSVGFSDEDDDRRQGPRQTEVASRWTPVDLFCLLGRVRVEERAGYEGQETHPVVRRTCST